LMLGWKRKLVNQRERAMLDEQTRSDAAALYANATQPAGRMAAWDRLSPAERETKARANIAKTGRSCGTCSLCCKLEEINDPELTKPAGVWCQHCRPGKGGCSIYATRPSLCRVYACQWLVDLGVGDHWQPMRSRMVLNIEWPDRAKKACLTAIVEPSRPDVWRQEPYYSDLKGWAEYGLENPEAPFIQVLVGKQSWTILPNKDVPRKRGYATVQFWKIAPGVWDVEELDDAAVTA
jgi:uncharacterized protein